MVDDPQDEPRHQAGRREPGRGRSRQAADDPAAGLRPPARQRHRRRRRHRRALGHDHPGPPRPRPEGHRADVPAARPRVQIPGRGTAKINEAYELGGPALTLRTVKNLTGLPINHVINVDFQGFESAVNAIGCIYVDVDRRYFNDTAEYAYINVPSGYQRLCGQQALEYARFRHEDTDLVRGVRQQEVIRATKQQAGVTGLIDKRDKLQQDLRQVHDLRRRAQEQQGHPQPAQAGRVQRRPAHPRGALRGRGRHHLGQRGHRHAQLRHRHRPHREEAGAAVPGRGELQGRQGQARARGGREAREAAAQATGPATTGWRRRPGPGKDQAVQAIQQGARRPAAGLLPDACA